MNKMTTCPWEMLGSPQRSGGGWKSPEGWTRTFQVELRTHCSPFRCPSNPLHVFVDSSGKRRAQRPLNTIAYRSPGGLDGEIEMDVPGTKTEPIPLPFISDLCCRNAVTWHLRGNRTWMNSPIMLRVCIRRWETPDACRSECYYCLKCFMRLLLCSSLLKFLTNILYQQTFIYLFEYVCEEYDALSINLFIPLFMHVWRNFLYIYNIIQML